MAIKFCGKSSLSMYVVLAVFIVAWTVNINLGQEIAFEIQGDVIIFEGDSLTIACTYSIKNEFSVFIALHGERTPVFTLTNITNATHIGNIGFITPSIGDETFVCMVKNGNIQITRNLTVSVLPRTFPYCSSNSSNEIIEGDAIFLSCYVDAADDDVTWLSNATKAIIQESNSVSLTTRQTEILIQPTGNENGSIYTCVNSREEKCSVGPIVVHENLLLTIQPYETDPVLLFPGQSKEFLCSSKPTSIITWEVRNQNANVEFLINGPLISTIVPSNSTFTGDVNITCFGIFEHYEASRVVNIRVLANDQNILYFVIGGSALLTVIVIFLIFLVCYLKRRKAVKNDEAETGIDLTPSVPATKAPGNFHNPAMTIGFGKESGETGAMQMDEPPPYSIVNKVIAKSKIQSDESRSYDHNTNPRPESSAYYTISAGSEGKHAVKCSGEPEGSKKEEDMVKRRITIHEDLIEGDDWSDSEDGDNFDSSLH